jgi:pyrroline-5-carboxylate reductase
MTDELATRVFGFVGTGTITEAVVTGLSKTRFASTHTVLSPRSEAVSKRLAIAHANVEVANSNQDVLDRADIVFIAVRPHVAEEVLRGLRFRKEHHVVSFVAATPLERLADWIGQPVRMSQAIPLPFVADLEGATAIHPRDPVSAAIFSELGTAIIVDTKAEYDLLAAASALMGTYFGILDAASNWLAAEGLSGSAADAYLRQLFTALGQRATARRGSSFRELVDEHSTKGGLNEQVLQDFTSLGGAAALETALRNVTKRIVAG